MRASSLARASGIPAEGFYLTDALTEYAVKFVEEALSKPKRGGHYAPERDNMRHAIILPVICYRFLTASVTEDRTPRDGG